MACLLVSVRSATEAMVAVRAGAHLIDVKEPKNGSLGVASARTWRAIRQVVPRHIPCSVALGELGQARKLRRGIPDDFQYVKIGLADTAHDPDWLNDWLGLANRLGLGKRLVAVVYADWQRAQAPPPGVVLEAAARYGTCTILWDTWRKDRPLYEWVSWDELAYWNRRAKERGMTVVVGGSLTGEFFAPAIAAGADVLAVRGAVCRGGRSGTVCEAFVRPLVQLATHIPPSVSTTAGARLPGVDQSCVVLGRTA